MPLLILIREMDPYQQNTRLKHLSVKEQSAAPDEFYDARVALMYSGHETFNPMLLGVADQLRI